MSYPLSIWEVTHAKKATRLVSHLTHVAAGVLDTNAEVFPVTKAKQHAVVGSSSAERFLRSCRYYMKNRKPD